MELPRGKFRALKRNTGLLFLIKDLKEEAFTGYCKIRDAERSMLLVFGKGTILLAACDDLAGDTALVEICSHRYSWVDAMLHDLDYAQLHLTLEFNPSLRVTKETGHEFNDQKEVSELQSLSLNTEGAVNKDLAEEKRSGAAGAGPDLPEDVAGGPELPKGLATGSNWLGINDPGGKGALLKDTISVTIDRESMRESITDPTNSPTLEFEPISSDSFLFEKKPLDLQHARITAPELNDLWRSMSVNKHQNNSV
ncbi:MAG: hypothetical protein LUQ33_00265 [Methanoregulaceae archaeon]|nr:hypothetical protein [Methanoregulaceae archaeon]